MLSVYAATELRRSINQNLADYQNFDGRPIPLERLLRSILVVGGYREAARSRWIRVDLYHHGIWPENPKSKDTAGQDHDIGGT